MDLSSPQVEACAQHDPEELAGVLLLPVADHAAHALVGIRQECVVLGQTELLLEISGKPVVFVGQKKVEGFLGHCSETETKVFQGAAFNLQKNVVETG